MEQFFARKSRLAVAVSSSIALFGALVHAQCALAAPHSSGTSVRAAAPLAIHPATALAITADAAKLVAATVQGAAGKGASPAIQDGGYSKSAAPTIQDGGYGKSAAPTIQDGGYVKSAAPSIQDGGYRS